MCIGGTPYVCSGIISLFTPTIAGVTKIAHRERVPNGALPKLGMVITPLWGRTTPSSKKRRLRWGCASVFHQLLCHHENMLLPRVVLVWQTLYCKELLAKQDIIAHWYYWTRLLIKILHRCIHSALQSLCVTDSIAHGYRYSLVDVILHQVTLQGWMPHLCSWSHLTDDGR